ncbi:MAG: hypothetical protein KatS3mg104_0633 [Phycisphaerae bacterium]|nr:MAG: hypothetical protein KatS3mg104_0633 [Phycisphaerae bacterium]
MVNYVWKTWERKSAWPVGCTITGITGGWVFIDLRDRDGLTQLVFDGDLCGPSALELARRLRNEWVISVTGNVVARGEGLANPKLMTGQIEVRVLTLDVLSESPTPPFLPDDREQVNEERRMRYRYIDLRRTEMQNTIRTRYQVTKIMRDHLGELGFLGDRDAISDPIHTGGGRETFWCPRGWHRAVFMPCLKVLNFSSRS